MTKIIAMLLILMVGLGSWGYLIVTHANTTHASVVQVTPTITRTEELLDRAATVLPEIKATTFYQGNSNLAEIALTFDDGPSPSFTPKVLSILKQYNVQASFFCQGYLVDNYPELVQQEANAGHVVGNHSWNHPDLTTLSTADAHKQLVKTNQAIQKAIGAKPLFFRPPYGAINNQVQAEANQMNFVSTLWNVDTNDWQMPGTDTIVKTVLDNAQNGSIILMHDGGGDRHQTVEALPTVIKELRARGYKLVTLQQLYDDMQKA